MDVDDYMGIGNVIGKLGKPRLMLIKALCCEKYGKRNHTAEEMTKVIGENRLGLYKSDGRLRNQQVIQDAMSDAYKKLKS